MAINHYAAGVGRALLFRGDNLIGVANTLTESTFDFSITAEEIRGGAGNALWGKYFHDSNLNVTLTDSMFNLEYIAASLGVNIVQGGISVMEEELAVGTGATVTLSETAVAFDGTMIGWYKLPSATAWTIGTITGGTTMAIPGATQNANYCVKYFYQNANAQSITIPTQYVPAELHVVILNDLYSGAVGTQSDTTLYGRLVTDIPRLQMDGNQNLALTATGAATVSLTGSALAVTSTTSCTDTPYYGTMTEEIFGTTWQDNVTAISVANGDVQLSSGGTETLQVYAIFGGSVAAQLEPNSAFTFTVETTPAATATGVQVGANTGIVTAGDVNGVAVISVALTNSTTVEPTYVLVTVA